MKINNDGRAKGTFRKVLQNGVLSTTKRIATTSAIPIYRVFFLTGPTLILLSACWSVSNRFQKFGRVQDWSYLLFGKSLSAEKM